MLCSHRAAFKGAKSSSLIIQIIKKKNNNRAANVHKQLRQLLSSLSILLCHVRDQTGVFGKLLCAERRPCRYQGEGLEIASLPRSGCFIYCLYKTWCLQDPRQDPGEEGEGKHGRWTVIKEGLAWVCLTQVLITGEQSPRVTQKVDPWDHLDQNLSYTAAKGPKENVP